ncbi:hypothetical protein TNCV_3745391 [Trichonephila clavipes]|nr:hypothetical protein TNCV_3745391 [Trichonephila clavipes]
MRCLQSKSLSVFLNLAKWNSQHLCNSIYYQDSDKSFPLKNISFNDMNNLNQGVFSTKGLEVQNITATIDEHNILTRVCPGMGYQSDVCRVTEGLHIEHLRQPLTKLEAVT